MVGAEIRCQLGELKLKDGRDAHAHIEKIIMLHEDLASVGQPVSDTDLFNIIYVSLPHSYNPGLAALSSTIHLQGNSVSSDDLMDIVLEEYNRLTLQDGRKGKKSALGEDAAFGADVSSRKGNGKGKKFGGNCYNCGWPGHGDCDCWGEGSGKAGQAPKNWKSCRKKSKDDKTKSSKPSANTAATNEPDSTWFATPHSELSTTEPIGAFLAWNDNIPELYDSGTLQHLSPCCKQFLNFISIPPKPIQSADNGMFDAIG